ncbi:MAG: CPBP family intramembrane metalloprotease [Flavobacteriaceae bacterium]|nr:MAG: CPBP family intramembrane metalloprotease [Flavobacteriaceae bacterium]
MKNKHAGWQRVLILILPLLITMGFFQMFGILAAGITLNDFSEDIVLTDYQHMITTFFGMLGVFLVLWVFMKLFDKENFIQMGFHLKGRFKETVVGVLAGAVIMGLGYVILLQMGEIQFSEVNFNGAELVFSILTFVFVAIMEEVLCRGYVLKNLMGSFNKYVALIVSSLLFSFMHGANPNLDAFALFNLFLAGIFLGISYIHTKNLWFPIALHFSWNLFQTLFGFNVSGQDSYSLVEFSMTEKNILNGGDFGFEGSVFAMAVMIVSIAMIELYYRKNNPQLALESVSTEHTKNI